MTPGHSETEIIIFKGVVQGVGFRPTVYRIAKELDMKGSVRNMGGSVQVLVTDTRERIETFVAAVENGVPRMARIDSVSRSPADSLTFADFTIEESTATETEAIILPYDIAVCDDCLREFADPENRRYRHPFISCTNCGPRYSIMESIPYDHDSTTMVDFAMCDACREEYENPLDRRYHAQTVSCHECGPQPLWWRNGDSAHSPSAHPADLSLSSHNPDSVQTENASADRRRDAAGGASRLSGGDAVQAAGEALAAGEVIAFKGTGGYYLSCDAKNEDAVKRLRLIKHREQKPFAVMFGSAEEAERYCRFGSEGERAALASERRPIVLLESRVRLVNKSPASELAEKEETFGGTGKHYATRLAESVANHSRYTGGFLPSLALQHMLLEYASPLVMTSANIEGIPIISVDEEIFDMLRGDGRIGGVLYNERRIAVSLDDSVVGVPVGDGRTRVMRRSKGYAPTPFHIRKATALGEEALIFAAGAHLKSVFALSKGSYAYLSPHLGDIDNVSSEELYIKRYEQMKRFFGIEPRFIVSDMHPRYFPTMFADGLSGRPASADVDAGMHETGFDGRDDGVWKTGISPRDKLLDAGSPRESGGIEHIYVQHHHAHAASVAAEHGIEGPFIGVAFDGTGYGEDGAVWGGEILLCEGAEYERYSHLRYIDMPGGDESMREAWKAGVAHVEAASPGGEKSHAPRQALDGAAGKPGLFPHTPRQALDGEAGEPGLFPHTPRQALDGEAGEPGSCARAPSPAGTREDGGRVFSVDISEIIAFSEENGTLADIPGLSLLREAIRQCENTVRSSSMGRLFDAAASLLGIERVNAYEGKCAIMLENAAQTYLSESGNLSKSADAAKKLAYQFHIDIAKAVQEECRAASMHYGKLSAKEPIKTVALSGGVFQNRILLRETMKLLEEDGFEVYTNESVPAGDGGIALGQAYIGMCRLLARKTRGGGA